MENRGTKPQLAEYFSPVLLFFHEQSTKPTTCTLLLKHRIIVAYPLNFANVFWQKKLGKKYFCASQIRRQNIFQKITMKNNYILTFLFLLSLTTFVHAQHHTNLPIDSRLFDAFDGEYLENLRTGNPFLLQRWNFYLDNSWYLTTLPPEKAEADYPSIRIGDLDNINIFLVERKFQLQRDWNKQVIYKIENSDKALVFIPGKEFTRKLNEHLNRK